MLMPLPEQRSDISGSMTGVACAPSLGQYSLRSGSPLSPSSHSKPDNADQLRGTSVVPRVTSKICAAYLEVAL